MSFDELLELLVANNIKIRAEGDSLRIKGNSQALTTEVTGYIKQHKASILDWLKQEKTIDTGVLNETPYLSFLKHLETPVKYHHIEAWFDDVCQHYPESIAVEYGEEKLAYSRLNASANRVANTLIDHGVTPGCVIGLLADDPVSVLGLGQPAAPDSDLRDVVPERQQGDSVGVLVGESRFHRRAFNLHAPLQHGLPVAALGCQTKLLQPIGDRSGETVGCAVRYGELHGIYPWNL